MKNTDMLEWMNDLDASYLREAAEPVIRQHKPIKKHLTAAIAAAAAAACLAVGVGAYVKYNQQMVQFGFGTLGEAMISEYSAPEPVTCSNGVVSVTVENVLSDGVQAMLLTTIEPVDQTAPFDWTAFDENYYSVKRNRFLLDGEAYTSHIATGFRWDALDMQNAQNQRWEIVYFTLPQDASDAALANAVYDCFLDVTENPDGDDYVYGTLFDGISIPVDLRQNVDSVKMRSEDGLELTLSAFEFYQDGYQATNNDFWNMAIMWKSGETERISYGDFNGSEWSKDTGARTWGEFAIPTKEPIGDTVPYIDKSKPEDWCGFINVKEVAAFRFGDRVYYPAE